MFLVSLLLVLTGCQGYDDQPTAQREAAQGIVAMDEDELEGGIGFSDEEIFNQQVSAGGSIESATASAWSGSGLLVTGDADQTVQIQVNFPASGPYTLQFSLEIPDGLVGSAAAIAEIDWKVEGNWVHRVVTLGSGTAVSGTAEACRVTIRDDSQVAPGQTYRASVQIGMGTRATTNQPPMYQPDHAGIVILAADLLGHPINIPRNAGVIEVWIPAVLTSYIMPTPGTVTAMVMGPISTLGFIDLTQQKWNPIPPGATQIVVFNNSGSDVWILPPIFGIEG